INVGLGATGRTLRFYPPLDAEQSAELADLKALAAEIGQVQTLVILGGNPVYDAPSDVDFSAILGREGLTSVVLTDRHDETGALASWHCPLAHELESWGDQRAVDGTLSIQQPLIAPLWQARS